MKKFIKYLLSYNQNATLILDYYKLKEENEYLKHRLKINREDILRFQKKIEKLEIK